LATHGGSKDSLEAAHYRLGGLVAVENFLVVLASRRGCLLDERERFLGWIQLPARASARISWISASLPFIWLDFFGEA
jgi:hypothetical protein